MPRVPTLAEILDFGRALLRSALRLTMSRAASLAAARLERSQNRDNARKAHTSASAYGAWFHDGTEGKGTSGELQLLGRPQPVSHLRGARRAVSDPRVTDQDCNPPSPIRLTGVPFHRAGTSTPTSDVADRMGKMSLAPSAEGPGGTGEYAGRNSVICEEPGTASSSTSAPTVFTELGMPEITGSSSGAFFCVSKEGAMHENHDKGATVILPDRTCLFAVLDGHGADGASVSGFSLRCVHRARRATSSRLAILFG